MRLLTRRKTRVSASTSTASVVVHVWPLRARFTEIFIRVKVAQLQLSRQTYLRRGSTVRHTTAPPKAPFLLNYSAARSVKLGEELVLNLKWDSAAQPRHNIQTPHRLLLVLHSVQVHSEARRTASRDRRLAYPSHVQRRPLPVSMLRFAQPARVFLSAGSLKNDLRYNSLCVPARGPHGPFLQWFSKDSASVSLLFSSRMFILWNHKRMCWKRTDI